MWEKVIFIPILIFIVVSVSDYFGLMNYAFHQIALATVVLVATAGIFRLHECLQEFHEYIHDDDQPVKLHE